MSEAPEPNSLAAPATQPAGPSRTRRNIKRAVILLTVLAVLAWGWHEMNVWPLRRALPSSATEVREWSQEDGFLPDYTYLLKARITPAEFQSYVDRIDLAPYSPTGKYDDDSGWVNWRFRGSCREEWWDPTDSLDGTFVWNHGDTWILAKYEAGYLYVKSLNH